MQPFETTKTAQNPQPTDPKPQDQPQGQPQDQPQAKTTYPTLERGPQPQAQQTGYPTFQQGASQPQPANYQPAFPSQAYQQRPSYPQQPQGYPQQSQGYQQQPQGYQQQYQGYQQQPQGYQQQYQGYQNQGYPMYQNQRPNYGGYNPGVQQAQGAVHKQMMMQQMSRNINASGQGLVLLYAFILVAGSVAGIYIQTQQTSYQLLDRAYKEIGGRYFQPPDAFSTDTCQAFLADILAIPYFLFAFGAYHFLSLCIAAVKTPACHVFHAIVSMIFAGIAVFASQQQCVGYSVLTTIFGKDNIPQNAWPYYAGMAGATLLACLLNYSWSSNRTKAERDQRNIALMMAA